VVGIAELLRAIGFAVEGPSLVLPDNASLNPLQQALAAWDARENEIAVLRNEAERIRQQNLAEVAALHASKQAQHAAVRQQVAAARKEVDAKPINASTGRSLKFGSTQIEVKPPPPPANAKGG
jgi:hypothetical protein